MTAPFVRILAPPVSPETVLLDAVERRLPILRAPTACLAARAR
ncbi:MAG: hypothetical protein AB1730_09520 [Myxococcota bacterium]